MATVPACLGDARKQVTGRRRFIRAIGTFGLASSAIGITMHRAYALAAPSAGQEGRFIMIFLRGGIDGLFALAPTADPRLAAVRPNLSKKVLEQGVALAGTGFSAHPACKGLAELFAARELLFCPTAGTTDASRSHFQAQDLFEIGSGAIQAESGFMARLSNVLGVERAGLGAISFTREIPLIFNGAETPPEVAPLAGSGLKLPEGRVLDAIRKAHVGLKTGEAIEQALATQAEIDAAEDMEGAARGAAAVAGFPKIAGHLGRILRANRRLSVAFVDIGGFDTHAGEEALLSRALLSLSEGMIALKESLGVEEWARTRIAVMSEFGRTVQENGTQGTDHGHGGLFLLAGGSIDGGRMAGQFTGLASSALNEGRDLRALADWRGLLSETLISTFGISSRGLDQVFPGRPKAKTGL